MSRRKNQTASCEGKVGFATFKATQIVATRGDGGGRDRKGSHAYHCEFCRKWHLGRAKKIARVRVEELE